MTFVGDQEKSVSSDVGPIILMSAISPSRRQGNPAAVIRATPHADSHEFATAAWLGVERDYPSAGGHFGFE